jgi:hypothetical protein
MLTLQMCLTYLPLPPLTSSRPAAHAHSDSVDLCGRPLQLTTQEGETIALYLDECSFDKRAATWEDIQIAAGVEAQGDKDTYCRDTICKESG